MTRTRKATRVKRTAEANANHPHPDFIAEHGIQMRGGYTFPVDCEAPGCDRTDATNIALYGHAKVALCGDHFDEDTAADALGLERGT